MSFLSPKISFRLPAVMIAVALAAIVATSVEAYRSSSRALESSAKNELRALMESRRDALQQYVKRIHEDLISTARARITVDALTYFDAAWSDQTDIVEGIRLAYIENRPHSSGHERASIESRPRTSGHDSGSEDDGHSTSYVWTHNLYHPFFRDLAQIHGYYDIFLIGSDGTILYSVAKEDDYATNLFSGDWNTTNLADLFNYLMANPSRGVVRLVDFEPYAPSNAAPASFIGTPMYNEAGEVLAWRGAVDHGG